MKHIFICYHHGDQKFADTLIAKIEKENFEVWVDHKLNAGDLWRDEIDKAIRSACALIVIMTPEARESEYVTYEWSFAWGVGVKIIPVIYKDTKLHPRLETLHRLRFTERRRPWRQLINAIKEAAREPALQLLNLLNEGLKSLQRRDYQAALQACDQALALDPNNVGACICKSDALNALTRYDEALTVSEQAIRLDPTQAAAWMCKGNALWHIQNGHETDALAAYEVALHLDAKNVLAWNNKGTVLHRLKRYDDALAAYERVIQLDPHNAIAWNGKGTVLHSHQRYDDALAAYDEALRCDPHNAVILKNRAGVLDKLGRTQEAQETRAQA